MPEKGIPSLKMAFQMPTKCQHAGIIRHLTNQTITRNNGIQKNTASNYKCQAGLNAAIDLMLIETQNICDRILLVNEI